MPATGEYKVTTPSSESKRLASVAQKGKLRKKSVIAASVLRQTSMIHSGSIADLNLSPKREKDKLVIPASTEVVYI